ncbi:MAG: hypothetical protein WBV53_03550 [Solirubrobacterales bacterium]
MARPPDDQGDPGLAVVLPTDLAETIREVLAHLRAQTVANQIELVVVAPSADNVLGELATELDGFHSIQGVELDPWLSLPLARAGGTRAARAPLIAFSETHCFPDPNWAETMIETHRGPWAAVGPEMNNENPARAISWANLLLDYGAWVAPAEAGPVDDLPGHNSCYKRAVLLDYGDELGPLLQAESILHRDLRARGHRLYLQPAAKVHHRNIARLGPSLRTAFQSGRNFAGLRERDWTTLRRAAYAAGSFLIPFVRLARIAADRRRKGMGSELPRVLPAMACVLIASAAGELVGYLAGGGSSLQRIAPVELHRDGT